MRKHGWQLPYHPLQVVAVAVFLALGFAFYVFFAPFAGKKFECIVIGLYTPLIACVFGLYIWCAGEDPADPGVFMSRKYVKVPHPPSKEFKPGLHSGSLDASSSRKKTDRQNFEQLSGTPGRDSAAKEKNASFISSNGCKSMLPVVLSSLSCDRRCSEDEHSEKQASEGGMFYCSLCEVEVLKYSKHCRVCDKCVDHFDHHCRWLNNCIGRKNYRKFFTLMVFTLLLLIVQWSTGILVIISCFLDRSHYNVEISSKLGSSFSLVPFVIVVAVCTVLAMVATLPVTQLFCFHVLLVKKGISTYDYIMAMREQEQQAGGSQQSPQMSPVSSITRLSSTSSMNTLRRGAWCTPPRLLLEDQFDVVPPETASVLSAGKKSEKKKKPAEVKISPWTLARLDAEEVSKAAAVARRKSRNRNNRRVLLPGDKNKFGLMSAGESSSLAPLQLEARSAFRTSRAMSSSTLVADSSPDSSLESPDLLHPCRASSADREEVDEVVACHLGSSRSCSDGYEASGGEDSDRVSVRMLQGSIDCGMGKGVAE